MVIDYQVAQYMASWMRDTLRYGLEGNDKVRGPDANHHLKRAFTGLWLTVKQNIKNGHQCVRGTGTNLMYGCLNLPADLIEIWHAEMAAQDAANQTGAMLYCR